ncbi:unnamed protein product [Chondrus crispus]|uniref:Uncharacterized protein n=1 Tax=Chondrus crispus TaxID=2769 RepID=R7QIJ1_CHOCR|nr:unnamed protein product [Chondrus crispus]CDF37296.1 unnamed protein product [Chondrus crispus]|eukprot:XP_005717115.1 unnamed protein product [Chondrus crispus]
MCYCDILLTPTDVRKCIPFSRDGRVKRINCSFVISLLHRDFTLYPLKGTLCASGLQEVARFLMHMKCGEGDHTSQETVPLLRFYRFRQLRNHRAKRRL